MSPRDKNHKVKDGEWAQPIQSGYKLSCCDCSLEHILDFRIRNGRIQFRARRDNRATANKRRGYSGVKFHHSLQARLREGEIDASLIAGMVVRHSGPLLG